MAENNRNLDMSMFENADLELNLELPEMDVNDQGNEEEEEIENPLNIEEDQEDEDKNNEIISEDESPEVVAEEEGLEEEEEESDSPLYSSFATVLQEQGLLPSLDLQDKKIETVDDLTEVIKFEIENQAKQKLIEKIGEDGYEALEKGISLAELQEYNQTANALENITVESLEGNIELAKKIILQDYINQGIDQNRALRILNKSVDLGEEAVIEDAIESLQSLKAYEQTRLQKLAEEREAQQAAMLAQQEKIDNDLKNSIYKKDEFIEGLKVTKAMQDRVYNSITKIVGKSPDGIAENKLMQQRRQDPIDFDTKLYYIFELTNGFKDFSKLVTKSASKATSQLERALRSNKFEQGENPSFIDKESYGGFGSELVL